MSDLLIGESFVGDGADAAHVNVVLGPRDGPAGAAWATALATPRAGHVPFVAIVRPGLAVQPPTLFVNKAAIEPGATPNSRGARRRPALRPAWPTPSPKGWWTPGGSRSWC